MIPETMSPKPPVCANGVHSDVIKRMRLPFEEVIASGGEGFFVFGVADAFLDLGVTAEAREMRTGAWGLTTGEADFALGNEAVFFSLLAFLFGATGWEDFFATGCSAGCERAWAAASANVSTERIAGLAVTGEVDSVVAAAFFWAGGKGREEGEGDLLLPDRDFAIRLP